MKKRKINTAAPLVLIKGPISCKLQVTNVITIITIIIIGPALNWPLVQGKAHLRPRIAGKGCSTPATRVRNKQCYKKAGWIMRIMIIIMCL